MDAPLDSIEYLSRSSHRVAILDTLIDTPRERAELRETVGASSSTIGRVLGEFTDRGWVVRAGHQYEPTPMGRFIGREFSQLLTTMEAVERLDDVMAWFPTAEMDFDFGALRDAEVTNATPANPLGPILTMGERITSAESVRLLVYAAIPQTLAALRDAVVNGVATVEAVFTAEMLDTVLADDRMCASFRAIFLADGADCYWYDDDISYAIALTDDRASISVSDDRRLPRALIETTDETVMSWATATYESYRRDSEPVDPDALDANFPSSNAP